MNYVVPDVSFGTMLERAVSIEQVGGRTHSGKLVHFDAETVTLIEDDTREVVTLARSTVTHLRAGETATNASSERDLADRRHFGVQFGVSPSLMFDYDLALLYVFADINIVFPLTTLGNTRPWFAGSVGAGMSFKVTTTSRWKLDIFASLNPVRIDSDMYIGFGVGVGMHYTFPSGFTFGFKVPALGYALRENTFGDSFNKASDGVGYFYLTGAMGLPLLSFGYRF